MIIACYIFDSIMVSCEFLYFFHLVLSWTLDFCICPLREARCWDLPSWRGSLLAMWWPSCAPPPSWVCCWAQSLAYTQHRTIKCPTSKGPWKITWATWKKDQSNWASDVTRWRRTVEAADISVARYGATFMVPSWTVDVKLKLEFYSGLNVKDYFLFAFFCFRFCFVQYCCV